MRFGVLSQCEGRFLSSPERVSAYAQAAEEAGFERVDITYSGGTKPERVQQSAELGVSRWVVPIWDTEPDGYRRAFDDLGRSLVGPLA